MERVVLTVRVSTSSSFSSIVEILTDLKFLLVDLPKNHACMDAGKHPMYGGVSDLIPSPTC
jgi:hypothetical protein